MNEIQRIKFILQKTSTAEKKASKFTNIKPKKFKEDKQRRKKLSKKFVFSATETPEKEVRM